MSIGYACLTLGVPGTEIKGCLLKNANEDNLARLVRNNLSSLKNIIDYNAANGILLFRISSDIIPFGSNSANTLQWKTIFSNELNAIGEMIKRAGIRVSMHPGQYTVLNSPNKAVVKRAIEDLNYHSGFLDSLGVDSSNKIVLHVGGAYGDKAAALLRFAQSFKELDNSVCRRLVIENDDRVFNIGDVLELASNLGLPVIYDNLHNRLNSCDRTKDDFYWVSKCALSWKEKDGIQKIHYSQQNHSKRSGSHSESIHLKEFMEFYSGLGERKPDIMLEVKDKNLSALKCINSTSINGHISLLEAEWARYKYAVLERSPNDYRKIRGLLRDKSPYPAAAFYSAVEDAYRHVHNQGNFVNAALHVWGYFKNYAGEKEKKRFEDLLQTYANTGNSVAAVKNHLFRLSVKYDQEYLLNSYYFIK